MEFELDFKKRCKHLTGKMEDLIIEAHDTAATETEQHVACLYFQGVFTSEATTFAKFVAELEDKAAVIDRYKDNKQLLYLVFNRYALILDHDFDLFQAKRENRTLPDEQILTHNVILRSYDEALDRLGVSDESYNILREYIDEYLREEGLLETPW